MCIACRARFKTVGKMMSCSLAILAALASLTAAAASHLAPLHLSDPTHVYDVIVIGAGMAGARAAAALLEGNVSNFLVVDQQPRLGGRMWNVAFGAWTIEKVSNCFFFFAVSIFSRLVSLGPAH
jgi:NADPH-dependent 2,4-dienoyl-CoA reductase/sulfur reductase-like enzyme